MPLPANSAWFTLNLNGQRDFQVYSFTGNEVVSLPYSFTVEVVRAAPVEDLGAFIGVPALLSIADRSGRSRLVHSLARKNYRDEEKQNMQKLQKENQNGYSVFLINCMTYSLSVLDKGQDLEKSPDKQCTR